MTASPSNEQFNIISDNMKLIIEQIEKAKLSAKRTDEVQIVAVTKTVSADVVNLAIESGIKLLGENRAQELISKYDEYNKAAQIHFIGHLQTNKVRSIVDKVQMIESIGSINLAKEVDKRCKTIGKTMDILIEVNAAGEQSKSGVDVPNLRELLHEVSLLKNVKIRGLMTIPPIGEGAKYFSEIQQIYIDIRSEKLDNVSMDFLSMGMSNDFPQAIQFGANIIRIGTKLFGQRN